MSKTFIMHGTQYFERPIELTINAPDEAQAEIRADEMTKGSGRRMSMESSSISIDFFEIVGEEVLDTPSEKRVNQKLKERLDKITGMTT